MSAIDFGALSAEQIWRRFLAISHHHHLVASFRGMQTQFLKMRYPAKPLGTDTEDPLRGKGPGAFHYEGDRLRVHCGDGAAIDVLRLRVETRRECTAAELANGYRLRHQVEDFAASP